MIDINVKKVYYTPMKTLIIASAIFISTLAFASEPYMLLPIMGVHDGDTIETMVMPARLPIH